MAEQHSHASRRIRLGAASVAAGTALAVGVPAYASAGTSRQVTPSPGDQRTATAFVGAAAKKHVTTLWLRDKSARVWKTWSRYHGKGGGYQGQFGVYRVSKYVYVYAQIHWNSGKYKYLKVKAGSTHTYRGAKSVYLELCGEYECSAWW